MSDNAYQDQYSDAVIASIEMVYGEGHLSPGGDQSIVRILDGLDISGKKVLEVGCGRGGGLVAMARDHGAGLGHGIDLEDSVLDQARKRISSAGLEDTVHVQKTEPGPFPFADNSYDFVMCKEMLCHIEDKPPFYEEIFRIIKPGGYLIGSDWFAGHSGPGTQAYKNWCNHMKASGLRFYFASYEDALRDFKDIGFKTVTITDNSDWILNISHENLASVKGPANQTLCNALGQIGCDGIILRTQYRIGALQDGALMHCNLRIQK